MTGSSIALEPIRVAIVAPSLRVIGGQSVQADRLRSALGERPDVEVVFVPIDPPLPGPFGALQRIRYVRTVVTSLAYVLRLIRTVPGVDVVHVFSASYLSFVLAPVPAVMAARVFGRRVVLNYHSGEAEDHLERWRQTTRPVLRHCDRIVVPSRYLADVFGRFHLDAEVVANGLDLEQMAFHSRERARPIFLSNRNLEPLYGVDVVLHAFQRIQAARPEARLLVAGGGSGAAAAKALADDLGLEGVDFLGSVPPETMHELYREADVFLNASRIDNMPLSILEAHASGTAVVSTDAGGIPYIAEHGVDAALVPVDDAESLAREALAVVSDPDRFVSMVEAGRRRSEREYGMATVVDRWVDVYRSVLHRKGRCEGELGVVERPGRAGRSLVSRGPAALAVRLRQEAQKRLEGWTGPLPSLRRRGGGATTDDPRAAAPAGFLPRALERRRGRHPEDRDAILAAADDVVAGRFEVLAHRLPAFEADRRWAHDPVTGRSTPDVPWHRIAYMSDVVDSDVKLLWELNRHGCLVRLAQAYFLTGRVEYASTLRTLLEGWIDQDRPGRGINWASSLEVAFRAVAWCWIWHLTADADIWDPAFSRRFLDRLHAHARHTFRYDSTHHSPNTHLLGEAVALVYVAKHFPGMRGSRAWAKRGVGILRREADRQILSDGMHFERSTGYHRYTMEFYLHLRLLLDASDGWEVASLDDVLDDLASAADALRRPDGRWPVLGDEDGGRFVHLSGADPVDATPIVRAVRSLIEGKGAAGPEGWWLGLDDSDAERASASRTTATPVDLSDAGYHVGPTTGGFAEWWVLVDTGPLGVLSGGHGHADLGHVEVAYGGRAIVADSGCGVYGARPGLRDWFRSESAHARPVLDGYPLAEPGHPFSWTTKYGTPNRVWSSSETVWHVGMSYPLGGPGAVVIHRRHVLLVAGAGLVVTDLFEGADALSGSIRWPLEMDGPLLSNDGVELGEVTMRFHGVGASRTLSAPVLKSEPRARSYGYIEEGAVIDVPFSGSPPFGVISVLSPRPILREAILHEGLMKLTVESETSSETVELTDPATAPSSLGTGA